MKYYIIILFFLTNILSHAQIAPLEEAPNLFGNKNQTSSISFNLNGTPISKGKSYFNSLGKGTQGLSWDVLTGKVWASQTLYDRHGRPALQTLSAPVNGGLNYSSNFILDGGGNSYSTNDFDVGSNIDDPSSVGASSELGAYYSIQNTTNSYQDITSYPFVRSVYSKLNPGSTKKVLGGNKIGADWKQTYSFSMPAGTAQNGACYDAEDAIYNASVQVTKTVSRDVHGEEVVVFVDNDGNTLAAARSGGVSHVVCDIDLLIGSQGYVDIHIPVLASSFSVNNPSVSASGGLKVYDLVLEQQINTINDATSIQNVGSGFYRIAVSTPIVYSDALIDQQNPIAPITISHALTYHDYSFNHFDKAGRLTSSSPPLAPRVPMTSTFSYNSLGQLLETTSPDEGTAKFRYRTDGQIRFSQNSLQALTGTFSYTNYDNLGRPIESGVYNGPLTFTAANVDTADGLEDEYCSEIHHTVYDIPDLNFSTQDCDLVNSGRHQKFVAGNVVKTYTASPSTATSWYSYDIQGRVTWIVQKIEGIQCYKTIDYTYDPVTGQVSMVEYQKNNTTDRFIHKYEYNAAGQLTKVYTSRTGYDGSYMEHASYVYAESGELIRTVLAENLQGIDYVYNLNGQLKAINHPSLLPTNDPGGDGSTGSTIAGDVFGFAIDYYDGDYSRTGTPTPVAQQNTNGTNQYNGNIKGVRFNTEGFAQGGGIFQSYMYQYNNKNWLQEAIYGSGNITSQGGGYKVNFTPNASSDYGVSNLTYDANGNIETLKRNGFTDGNGTNSMDNFNYQYDSNKLQLVEDSGDNSDPNRYDDLKNQENNGGANYIYNEIGQLVSDAAEGVTYEYNASGLVTRINSYGVNQGNGNGQQIIIYKQPFTDAINSELGYWTLTSGEKSINYQGIYKPELTGGSCSALEIQYAESLILEMPNNARAKRELDVIASVPHTLDLDVIVDQWGASQLPAGYVIYIYNNNTGALPTAPIASTSFNTTLDYINTGGGDCGKFYDRHETLTFTPAYGKITFEIKKVTTSGQEPMYLDNITLSSETTPMLDISYNDRGQRVKKTQYHNASGNVYETYYVRDAAGTVMAIYNVTNTVFKKNKPIINEIPIYGASRIGVCNVGSGNGFDEAIPDVYHYQLTDHLGNVRAVVGKAGNGTPYVVAKTDYYPYGMPMPNRNVEGQYRYGYQGEFAEKDPETGLNAFELRMWDSRIGRWLTVDPRRFHDSPYLGMANNPAKSTDPSGGSPCPPDCGEGGAPGASQITDTNFNGGVPVQLDQVVVMASSSSYNYSQETIPGKFAQDWNFILNGLDGNGFTRFGDIFSRDWNANSSSQKTDFGIDVATSIIPGGFVIRNSLKLGKGASKLLPRLVKYGKNGKLPVPIGKNPQGFTKIRGTKDFTHNSTGAIYKNSKSTHGSKHGTQWKAYPKGTKNFSKQQGNRLTIDGDGTLIGN